MRSVIRYKTKPGRGDENQKLVEKVYQELAAKDPGALRYATFRLSDGVTFVHIAVTDSEDNSNPLREVAAFAEFQRELTERCDEQPVVEAATIVGSYRFFAA